MCFDVIKHVCNTMHVNIVVLMQISVIENQRYTVSLICNSDAAIKKKSSQCEPVTTYLVLSGRGVFEVAYTSQE